jgi:two-component system response regulator MtrA
MFTGLVEEAGRCEWLRIGESGAQLAIRAPRISDTLRIGDSVAVNGCCLTVTRTADSVMEFDLLVALAKDPGRVFTRDALLSEVWGYRHSTDTRLVNVHVQRLRSKIEHDPEHPEIVMTVRGVGYKAGGTA